MVADAFILIFPLLAAIPLVAVFFLSRLPGQENQFAWRTFRYFAWSFVFWQWLLAFTLYAHGPWLELSRALDPFFCAGFLYCVLLAEGGGAEDHLRHLYFARKISPWLGGNALVQLVTIFFPISGYFSVLAALIAGAKLVGAYAHWTIRPRIRHRVTLFIWMAVMLVPLPFFRVFFLAHLAYVWMSRVRMQLGYLAEQRRAQENEKRVISHISETLSTVIQDVGNFQQSLSAYLQGLCGSLEVKAGAVYLWDAEAKVFRVGQVYGLFFPLTHSVEHTFMRERALHELVMSIVISTPDNLVWECGHGHKPIHLPYASQDLRIQKLGRDNNIQSLILTPLMLEHELLGVLVLQNKLYERYFTESDAYLAYTFAHYATLMINAERMLRDRAERERVQNELMLGQRIQYDLLPRTIPSVPGIELAGSMVPAKEIGGDYYDFIDVGDGRLGIAIGDVSGKGVPAGMLMTILQALLHSQYRYFSNTRDLLVDINTSLAQKITSSMFITFLLFEWNCQTRTLKYSSCGHEHILHFRAKENHLDCFRSGGIALGMTEDNSAIVRERALAVSPGDTVMLYTDGVIEARNPEGEMFGLGRLKAFLEQHQGTSAEVVRKALMDALDLFRRGSAQVDDITCLVMRF